MKLELWRSKWNNVEIHLDGQERNEVILKELKARHVG
jgi:hypothetical protein